MNPEEMHFDEDDKKLYLTLQKAGKVIPCDVDEVLDENEDCDELPPGLQDVDAAVKKIMTGGVFPRDNVISIKADKKQDAPSDSEWAMAARHGAKLSEASREKIRKIRESKE